MGREEALRDQQFEQPFDSCPIETPSMWEYRGLMNVGGHVYCRIWRHKADDKEVMYNMLDERVTVIGAKYHPESEQYEGDLDTVIDEKFAESNSVVESDLQQLAIELMESHK